MKKLVVKNLKKYYGRGENLVRAVDGISLEIEPSKFTAIVGTSGSGKTTFLHCVAGLDSPTSGNVYLGGKDIYTLGDNSISRIRRREFGFIFQNFNLIPVLNVYDNIILPIQLDGREVDKEYTMKIVNKMGLSELLKRFPNELSGGQQQRVAIARALSNRPSVIFADEPTGNLDSKTTKEVMELLKETVCIMNQTLVMITHDQNIAEQADRIITLNDGKIIEDSNEKLRVN